MHDGRTYELTGPALSTPRQRAADLAAAPGEPIISWAERNIDAFR